jgi:hypothetical protein
VTFLPPVYAPWVALARDYAQMEKRRIQAAAMFEKGA